MSNLAIRESCCTLNAGREEDVQTWLRGVWFDASWPGMLREAYVGAFSFDGRIVTVLFLGYFGLVDMLHRDSDKRLGQRKVCFGFGLGLLLGFSYVCCTRVSRRKQ